MESTTMRSPPTSRESDARSSVVVTTFGFEAALAVPAASVATTASIVFHLICVFGIQVPPRIRTGAPHERRSKHGSKRVRPMSAHRELELKQKFVGREILAVTGAAQLAADLAELAWPLRQDGRAAGVLELRVVEPFGAIEASAHKPAPPQLVIARDVVSERLRQRHGLGTRPDEFAAGDKRVID